MRKKQVAANNNETLTTFARSVGSAMGTIVSKASRVIDVASKRSANKAKPAKSKKSKNTVATVTTKKKAAKKVSKAKGKTARPKPT